MEFQWEEGFQYYHKTREKQRGIKHALCTLMLATLQSFRPIPDSYRGRAERSYFYSRVIFRVAVTLRHSACS